MSDKVQLIKEEIDSYKESMKGLEPHSDFRRGQITAYNQIMQFIDSIPEESTSEDLDEEIGKYTTNELLKKRNHSTGIYHLTQKDCDDIARHFAEWQKQKDQETIELAEDHAMLAGMMKEREEMMKDAVEANVYQGLYSKYVKESDSDALANVLKNYNSGDKVKIIIVKTD